MTYIKRLGLLTSSGVPPIIRSPAHYKQWVESNDEDSESKKGGSLFHKAVLQQDAFIAGYYPEPDFGDSRTTAAKVARKDFEKAFADKIRDKSPIPAKLFERIAMQITSLSNHPIYKAITAPGARETPIYWTENGVECRATPDLLLENGLCIDLKTTRDASDDGFRRSYRAYGYDIQAAMMELAVRSTGRRYAGHLIVAIETSAPYAVNLFKPSRRSILEAHEKVSHALAIMRTCIESGQWPGYGNEVKEIT